MKISSGVHLEVEPWLLLHKVLQEEYNQMKDLSQLI